MNENGLLSRVPTLNKLKELESTGKIIVLGDNNRRGQPHFLAINNKSAYNRIYNWLTEIEHILDQMELTFEYVHYYMCGPAPDDPAFRDEFNKTRSMFLDNLRNASFRPIERLLNFLYILSNRVVQSAKDSQLLNERIVDLHIKLMNVFKFMNTLDDIDIYLKSDMSELNTCLEDKRIHEYIAGTDINLESVYNLPIKIEKFRKEIMEDFSRI